MKNHLLSFCCLQVRQIESFLPEKRQNLMFSATIPPRVERMAIQMMKEPLYTVLGKVLIHVQGHIIACTIVLQKRAHSQMPTYPPVLSPFPVQVYFILKSTHLVF